MVICQKTHLYRLLPIYDTMHLRAEHPALLPGTPQCSIALINDFLIDHVGRQWCSHPQQRPR